MPKRKSYSADLKLNVINYGEVHGNTNRGGREFSVDEKSIRELRKVKMNLEKMHTLMILKTRYIGFINS